MEKNDMDLLDEEPIYNHCLSAAQVEEINDLIWNLGMRVHEILSGDS